MDMESNSITNQKFNPSILKFITTTQMRQFSHVQLRILAISNTRMYIVHDT